MFTRSANAVIATFFVLLLILSDLRADEGIVKSSSPVTPAAPEATLSQHLRDRAKLFKTRLDAHGLRLDLAIIDDWSKNFRGGASSSGSFNRYSLDVSMAVDTKRLTNLTGGTAFVRLKNHVGANGADFVGDEQGFSNIDDAPRTRLYELWYEQRVGDRIRFKGGKIDANTEFAVVQVAADFVNSSMGYSPTILALPTYPQPRPGLNLFLVPSEHYLGSLGIFRTAENGEMLLLEGSRGWSLSSQDLRGRSSFGLWRLTGTIPCFDGGELSGTQGLLCHY